MTGIFPPPQTGKTVLCSPLTGSCGWQMEVCACESESTLMYCHKIILSVNQGFLHLSELQLQSICNNVCLFITAQDRAIITGKSHDNVPSPYTHTLHSQMAYCLNYESEAIILCPLFTSRNKLGTWRLECIAVYFKESKGWYKRCYSQPANDWVMQSKHR